MTEAQTDHKATNKSAGEKTIKSSSKSRNRAQRIGFSAVTVVAFLTIIPIFLIIGTIVVRGFQMITPEFIFEFPREGMKAGGIWPAIVGTIYLIIGTAIFSVPLGIAAAIYLSEYSPNNRLTQTIRVAIITLAGIPSVVYGLFGLGIFVLYFQFGTSILAGSLTLAIMNIPVIISTSEEALRSVPQEFRVVSISLGATRWQTIRRIVLPQAVPGILTGVILGLERAGWRDRPHSLHSRSFLFDQSAVLAARPDNGAALPPVCDLDSGAWDASVNPIRHCAGPAVPGVGDELDCDDHQIAGSRSPPVVAKWTK